MKTSSRPSKTGRLEPCSHIPRCCPIVNMIGLKVSQGFRESTGSAGSSSKESCPPVSGTPGDLAGNWAPDGAPKGAPASDEQFPHGTGHCCKSSPAYVSARLFEVNIPHKTPCVLQGGKSAVLPVGPNSVCCGAPINSRVNYVELWRDE